MLCGAARSHAARPARHGGNRGGIFRTRSSAEKDERHISRRSGDDRRERGVPRAASRAAAALGVYRDIHHQRAEGRPAHRTDLAHAARTLRTRRDLEWRTALRIPRARCACGARREGSPRLRARVPREEPAAHRAHDRRRRSEPRSRRAARRRRGRARIAASRRRRPEGRGVRAAVWIRTARGVSD